MSDYTVTLRSELVGNHVQERVFVGPDEGHLALAGTLMFRVGEWQAFGATLLAGSGVMPRVCRVLLEGDDAIVRELAARDEQ